MNIQLFGSRLSPFVEKCARALQMKGLAFTLVPVRSPRDFARWNPQTGKMPVLDVDGERTWDSTRILARLDELVPTPRLYSTDPDAAARQRFLEDWSDESLYWYVMALRWCDENAVATSAQVLGDVGAPSFLHGLLTPLARWQIGSMARAQGLGRAPTSFVLEELGKRLEELEVMLAGRAFFFSDEPGGADVALFGQMNAMRSGPTPEAANCIEARPRLLAWAERVDAATSTSGAGSRSPA